MAWIKKIKRRKPWQVGFKLRDEKVRTQTFATQAEAKEYRVMVQRMEHLSRQGMGDVKEVVAWVKDGHLSDEQAAENFNGYQHILDDEGRTVIPIDFSAIRFEFERRALSGSKAKDPLRKTHRDNMVAVDRLIAWLKTEHPKLDLTKQDVIDKKESLRIKGLSVSSRFQWHHRLRMFLDAAERLGMIWDNVARLVDNPQRSMSGRRKKRRILSTQELKLVMEGSLTYKGDDGIKARMVARDERWRAERERLEALPLNVGLAELQGALNCSKAAWKRYVSEGRLKGLVPPRVDTGWTLPRATILDHLEAYHQEKRIKPVKPLPDHKRLLRGCLPLVVRLGYYCGLRNEEVVWLPWDHIYLEGQDRYLRVTKVVSPLGVQWSPKDDYSTDEELTEERELGFPEEMKIFLLRERERQERVGIKTFFVIPSGLPHGPVRHGQPLSPEVLTKAMHKLDRHIGPLPLRDGKSFTFYSFRHTYCTTLIRNGVDLETVRERMGHSDIRTTMGYLHHQDTKEYVEDVLALEA